MLLLIQIYIKFGSQKGSQAKNFYHAKTECVCFFFLRKSEHYRSKPFSEKTGWLDNRTVIVYTVDVVELDLY